MINKLFKICLMLIFLFRIRLSDGICKTYITQDDFKYALLFNDSSLLPLERDLKILVNNESIQGKISFGICKETEVPKECQSQVDKAQMIFSYSANDVVKCIIIKSPSSWKNQINEIPLQGPTSILSENNNDYNIKYNFICDKIKPTTDINVNYANDNKTFIININSADSCLYDITPTLIGSIGKYLYFSGLVIFGIIYCYFGLKFKNEYPSVIVAGFMYAVAVLLFLIVILLSDGVVRVKISLPLWLISFCIILALVVYFKIIIPILITLLSCSVIALEIRESLILRMPSLNAQVVYLIFLIISFVTLMYLYIKNSEFHFILISAMLGSIYINTGLLIMEIIPKHEPNDDTIDYSLITLFIFLASGLFVQNLYWKMTNDKDNKKDIDLYLENESKNTP